LDICLEIGETMDIEEMGNNRYKINGEIIYAPNVEVAIRRYKEMK